jgi:hypothetical protein
MFGSSPRQPSHHADHPLPHPPYFSLFSLAIADLVIEFIAGTNAKVDATKTVPA